MDPACSATPFRLKGSSCVPGRLDDETLPQHQLARSDRGPLVPRVMTDSVWCAAPGSTATPRCGRQDSPPLKNPAATRTVAGRTGCGASIPRVRGRLRGAACEPAPAAPLARAARSRIHAELVESTSGEIGKAEESVSYGVHDRTMRRGGNVVLFSSTPGDEPLGNGYFQTIDLADQNCGTRDALPVRATSRGRHGAPTPLRAAGSRAPGRARRS